MIHFLLWWSICSYVIGLPIFIHQSYISWSDWKSAKTLVRNVFGQAILLILGPLITWHGVLHYLQVWYCKLVKRPLKFWI